MEDKDMLTGNDRCLKCLDFHPMNWDCQAGKSSLIPGKKEDLEIVPSADQARELLPCPFCGNSMTGVDWHTKLFVGHASNCFLHGQPLFSDNIAAWNRRATFIERTAATEPQVTEEMVERACRSMFPGINWDNGIEGPAKGIRRNEMRRVLLAALSGKGQSS